MPLLLQQRLQPLSLSHSTPLACDDVPNLSPSHGPILTLHHPAEVLGTMRPSVTDSPVCPGHKESERIWEPTLPLPDPTAPFPAPRPQPLSQGSLGRRGTGRGAPCERITTFESQKFQLPVCLGSNRPPPRFLLRMWDSVSATPGRPGGCRCGHVTPNCGSGVCMYAPTRQACPR